ncbi:hypothetical protein SAMN04488531_1356 [Corynebacterium coyleae]|uniref:Lipoprotein n=1 Tax=Corynebacterium coyleae TaxID=53374 RepID=A0ABX8KSW0_9CORY|nr:hypothetical protein [Corynebacterium coyleae]QXB17582.1 hypothetical protein I6L55_06445 [Corynebacterium coyleae]WJY78966.1 hypothetical protein CCOY_01690 [Corynebacterium coyleae]SEB62777.1 hypothetical protein SAMN04488531_1356 [Corynebacterium coyleae]
MKRHVPILATTLLLAACGTETEPIQTPAPETTTVVSHETVSAPTSAPANETSTDATTASATPTASIRDLYAEAIADPARFFADLADLDGTFTYDVLDINGDLEPELLLRAGVSAAPDAGPDAGAANGNPSPVRVLRAQNGEVTWTKDYLVDSDEPYPTVFTNGTQPGLDQYETDGPRLNVTHFELRGQRLEKVWGPEETVVGNPLSDVTRITWHPTTDAAALDKIGNATLRGPLEGTMGQVSKVEHLQGEQFRVRFEPTADGIAVTYPDLGCAGHLAKTEDGFRETITEGTCDNGGTWHLLIDDNHAHAFYNSPDGRYTADGRLTPAG